LPRGQEIVADQVVMLMAVEATDLPAASGIAMM